MKGNAILKAGEKIRIEIDGISHDGSGIGRYCGFAVFVPGALIGEAVEVLVKQVNRTFAMAGLEKIFVASPTRMNPLCGVYGRCGGCQLQHASYQEQLEIKRMIVQNALRRLGGLTEVEVSPVIGMQEPWGYRNRAQFHFRYIGGHVRAGFFHDDGKSLIALEHCYLVPDIFNRITAFITANLNKNISSQADFDKAGLLHLVLKISAMTEEIAIIFVVDNEYDARIEELIPLLIKEFPQVTAIEKNINQQKTGPVFAHKWQHLWGKERLTDSICGNQFDISPASFIQVNPEQTDILYGKALAFAGLKKEEIALDVYCGIGTITLMLAKHCKRVYGIEEYPAAVSDARANAVKNSIKNVEFTAGKAENVLPDMYQAGIRTDLIVVDPPRSGCDAKVLQAMANMSPRRIVYVSCDPATLARDMKYLTANGYIIEEVQPVDMFPQTAHVETCVLLSHKNS